MKRYCKRFRMYWRRFCREISYSCTITGVLDFSNKEHITALEKQVSRLRRRGCKVHLDVAYRYKGINNPCCLTCPEDRWNECQEKRAQCIQTHKILKGDA